MEKVLREWTLQGNFSVLCASLIFHGFILKNYPWNKQKQYTSLYRYIYIGIYTATHTPTYICIHSLCATCFLKFSSLQGMPLPSYHPRLSASVPLRPCLFSAPHLYSCYSFCLECPTPNLSFFKSYRHDLQGWPTLNSRVSLRLFLPNCNPLRLSLSSTFIMPVKLWCKNPWRDC